MKKQAWILIIIVVAILLYFLRGGEQFSPRGCEELLLDINVPPQEVGRHNIQLEVEDRNLAVIKIDGERELFRGYSTNYYDFGKARVTSYGPVDGRLTAEFCIS